MREASSIFQRYYKQEQFHDRLIEDKKDAVDVIIPIIHTNELWETNLKSIYREIPVNRLLISDGGCLDDSIVIVNMFPRVEIFDHKIYKTLGYCLRKLIEEVETEWFIYIHSDIYLPDGYFDNMKRHKDEYDWFASPQKITAMVEYFHLDKTYGELRPSMGSQMGRKKAFMQGIGMIEDDYVYRQEDFVLAKIVETSGFKYGHINDTFHYHQVMHKDSPWRREIENVSVKVKWSEEEMLRTASTQAMGIIKYLEPNYYMHKMLLENIYIIHELSSIEMELFVQWLDDNVSVWSKLVNKKKIRKMIRKRKTVNFISSKLRDIKRLFLKS